MDDELLVKYLLAEASATEQKMVDEWISASDENRKYFTHFQLIWELSKHVVIPPTVTPDEAWQRFRHRTSKLSGNPAIARRLGEPYKWIRAASIAVLCLGLLAFVYILSGRSAGAAITISTTIDTKPQTLPDGSLVTLNKNSSISYNRKFNDNKRKVELKGEAFFNVTPDKQKPFVITVNDITVTVVGTSFNIRAVEGKTEVVVETGIVAVTSNNKILELHANEKLLIENSEIKKELVTDKLHQYYRSKQFVCDNTPLWKLVEVLNEAYNVNIVFARNDLRSLPLNTTFNNESLDKILLIISETFQISVERKADQIILK